MRADRSLRAASVFAPSVFRRTPQGRGAYRVRGCCAPVARLHDVHDLQDQMK
jgi:hypothetical protein